MARATAGEAHVLYEKSPGGAVSTAARVANFRPLIDRVTAGTSIDPNLLEGLVFAYLGTPYVLGGWRGFNRSLVSTPLPDLLSGLLGMVVGLVIAVLVGVFVRELPFGYLLSSILALLLAALGASVGVTRRAELAAIFFGGAADQPQHHLTKVLLDTSVIIDGRILDIAKTGFVDMPLVILSSVLRELQLVADSADAMRRRRGRRGLDVLTEMQKEHATITLEIVDDEATPSTEIDAHLVRTAKRRGWAIMFCLAEIT